MLKIVPVLLVLSVSVCRAVPDTAPEVADATNYPYLATIIHTAGVRFDLGLVVARMYVVANADILPTTNLEELLIVTPDAISTHAQKIVTDGQISVIKICAMMYPTYPVYKLTPSLFFGFTTASAAIYIYLDSMDMKLMYVNTTVLPDAECPSEIFAEGAPTGVTFNAAKHICQLVDCTASCKWTLPTTEIPPRTTSSILLVNNHVVGFLRGGKCNTAAPNQWTSAVIYNKILPSRSYIISASNNMVMVR